MYRWILRFRPVIVILLAAVALWSLCLFVGENPPLTPKHRPPPGAQLLTFPLNDALVTAGYLNAEYVKKNSYAHFGLDVTPSNGSTANALSVGSGVVLGTEFCDNSLGNVIVVLYDNVYNPTLGRVAPLAIRYYHLLSCSVRTGDTLVRGQVIGSVDGKHKWYNHVHVEVDADIRFPFNTPQVAETSSNLLVRFPASGESLLDPVSVLILGSNQSIELHPAATCRTDKDRPALLMSDFVMSMG